jgi:NCAIR mutase (PurE)-related protein
LRKNNPEKNMDEKQLHDLLSQVQNGHLPVDKAVAQLRKLPFEDMGFARLDHHRSIRCGFPEVIYCPGKTTDQIAGIFEKLAETGHNVLASRAGGDVFDTLQKTGKYPDLQYDDSAKAVYLIQESQGTHREDYIAIVTAGTADLPVACEAKVTVEVMGQTAQLLADVGVAGLHRLLGNMDVLHKASVVIVVAGMEGALASVVGGLVDCPVIAVPTSVGYGASFEGLSALLTMLNSCASGVTVVNIDNGFGAGYAAGLIMRKIQKRRNTHAGNH